MQGAFFVKISFELFYSFIHNFYNHKAQKVILFLNVKLWFEAYLRKKLDKQEIAIVWFICQNPMIRSCDNTLYNVRLQKLFHSKIKQINSLFYVCVGNKSNRCRNKTRMTFCIHSTVYVPTFNRLSIIVTHNVK